MYAIKQAHTSIANNQTYLDGVDGGGDDDDDDDDEHSLNFFIRWSLSQALYIEVI